MITRISCVESGVWQIDDFWSSHSWQERSSDMLVLGSWQPQEADVCFCSNHWVSMSCSAISIWQNAHGSPSPCWKLSLRLSLSGWWAALCRLSVLEKTRRHQNSLGCAVKIVIITMLGCAWCLLLKFQSGSQEAGWLTDKPAGGSSVNAASLFSERLDIIVSAASEVPTSGETPLFRMEEMLWEARLPHPQDVPFLGTTDLSTPNYFKKTTPNIDGSAHTLSHPSLSALPKQFWPGGWVRPRLGSGPLGISFVCVGNKDLTSLSGWSAELKPQFRLPVGGRANIHPWTSLHLWDCGHGGHRLCWSVVSPVSNLCLCHC